MNTKNKKKIKKDYIDLIKLRIKEFEKKKNIDQKKYYKVFGKSVIELDGVAIKEITNDLKKLKRIIKEMSFKEFYKLRLKWDLPNIKSGHYNYANLNKDIDTFIKNNTKVSRNVAINSVLNN